MEAKALLQKVLDALAALEGTRAEVMLPLPQGEASEVSVALVREVARMAGVPVVTSFHTPVTGDAYVQEKATVPGPGTGEWNRPVASLLAWRPATIEDVKCSLRAPVKEWHAKVDANAAANAGVAR